MADEQGPDELSKRERQKARRQARRQEELAKAKRQQTKSKAGRILAILVVLGLLGFLVGRWWIGVQRDNDLREQAQARLSELGCTEDAMQPDVGAGHIEDLVQLPPETTYPDRPATSGPHVGSTVAKSGVYDKVIDERLMVHNLEHGYVNIYYSDDAPADQVEDMKEWAADRLDGNPKMIVAPQHGEWSDPDRNFAFVAWRFRQMCETWDPGVALLFMDAHYGLSGIAPEKSVPAHTGGSGVVDPDETEGPVVFPPLTEDNPHEAPAQPPAGEAESGTAEGADAGNADPGNADAGEADAGS